MAKDGKLSFPAVEQSPKKNSNGVLLKLVLTERRITYEIRVKRFNLHGHRFLEFAALLYLEHEIATVDVYHDKVEPIHGLEAGMELDQKRRLVRQGQDVLFHQRALDVVVLNDDVLLQDLDGVQLVRTFAFGQHHLVTFRPSSSFNVIDILSSVTVRHGTNHRPSHSAPLKSLKRRLFPPFIH
jgi:hypothetical protein